MPSPLFSPSPPHGGWTAAFTMPVSGDLWEGVVMCWDECATDECGQSLLAQPSRSVRRGKPLSFSLCAAQRLIYSSCCRPLQKLDRHQDEVWFVEFSHDGSMLASASRDGIIILWSVPSVPHSHEAHITQKACLRGHSGPLLFLAWSPDDRWLLSCGSDKLLKLWETATGECVRNFLKQKESVTSCAWFPSGNSFVSSSLDKSIVLWHIGGDVVQKWHGIRVADMAVTGDGATLIMAHGAQLSFRTVTQIGDGRPSIVGIERHTLQEGDIEESEAITSIALSSDSRLLLVNLGTANIHLWQMEADGAGRRMLQSYSGHKQGRFVIRSTFGGQDDAFVVSGSEDSQIYIWCRNTGALLKVLSGHSRSVNSVSWSPKDPYMLASASDDDTIWIWGAVQLVQSGNRLWPIETV
mmetsp:Transcript_23569/g.65057  ORF Transcript_23569/g.65057 Transcript_23569/m.65057 type:complete len:410 (+) Transcript_23569:1001-2230(+)